MLTPRRKPSSEPSELDCDRLVELVTDYLEGALDPATTARVEAHLAICDDCETYLQQVRDTVAHLGRVTSQNLPADTRTGLLAAFRDLDR